MTLSELLMTITGKHTLPEGSKMLFPTKVIELHPTDNEHIKRLNDPAESRTFPSRILASVFGSRKAGAWQRERQSSV